MMTMKKAVMFSVAALLAVSTMATQAQEAVAPAETQTADATEVTTAEDPAQVAAPVEEAPKESPQVQKLVAMYPNLIARIAPYGKVCFDGEECDINITVLAPAVEGQARDGESLYKAICSTCHDAGLIGAPKLAPAIGHQESVKAQQRFIIMPSTVLMRCLLVAVLISLMKRFKMRLIILSSSQAKPSYKLSI